jgi:hypothetical protein
MSAMIVELCESEAAGHKSRITWGRNVAKHMLWLAAMKPDCWMTEPDNVGHQHATAQHPDSGVQIQEEYPGSGA